MSTRITFVAALAFLVAACGGSDGATDDGVVSLEDASGTDEVVADDSTTDDVEQSALAFAECLREQGLDVPDPEFDGEGGFAFNFGEIFGGPGQGGPNEDFQEAFGECGDLLAGVAQQFQNDFDQTELEDGLLAFAECMRDGGIDVADPDLSAFTPGEGGPGGGGGPGGLFGSIDLDDPAVIAVLETCQSELAFGGPGGFGGGG